MTGPAVTGPAVAGSGVATGHVVPAIEMFLPPAAPAAEIIEGVRHAEALGLESVWAIDHLTGRYPMLDAGLVLATAAVSPAAGAALRSTGWTCSPP